MLLAELIGQKLIEEEKQTHCRLKARERWNEKKEETEEKAANEEKLYSREDEKKHEIGISSLSNLPIKSFSEKITSGTFKMIELSIETVKTTMKYYFYLGVS